MFFDNVAGRSFYSTFFGKAMDFGTSLQKQELLATVFFDKMLQFGKEFLSTTYVELFNLIVFIKE